MEFERSRRKHTHIDIAPLVDVVFNLLLFFVITYNVTTDPAIRVRLPESLTADVLAEEPLVVTVTREGAVYIGDQPTAIDDVAGLVREKIAGVKDPSVKVKADQDAPVGLLIKVVDSVRLAGCSAFSIMTDKASGER
ncbi:MAG: ExbD/TolR family protein [Syntrophobacteraceae bacterium]